MTVSLHTAGANTFDLQRKQIDAAVDLGAEVIVLHPSDFVSKDSSDLDVQLACKAVAYASERGVRLALENGQLPFLVNAIEKVEGLGICLDVGHVYLTPDPMNKFLAALKQRIIHLHIQDVLPEAEAGLPCTGKDHYIPGTGGIPDKDWRLFAATLKEINFQGIAVFEIQPRNPLQTAFLGRTFMRKLLEM
jgi:sugar phosphate isomerase/epimerase